MAGVHDDSLYAAKERFGLPSNILMYLSPQRAIFDVNLNTPTCFEHGIYIYIKKIDSTGSVAAKGYSYERYDLIPLELRHR